MTLRCRLPHACLAVALNLQSYAATHQIDSGPDWTIEIGKE